jgi:hypothetical protein
MVEHMSEIWKVIPPYPLYEVSNLARIRRKETGRVIKSFLRGNGYYLIRLTPYSKNIAIHRLIAFAFIDNVDNKPYINHKNGIKTDNRIENLEWVTGKENRIHAVSTGLITNTTKGKRSHSKLDITQVLTIRKCLNDGMLCKPLADYFHVSQTLISAIKRRVAWAGI